MLPLYSSHANYRFLSFAVCLIRYLIAFILLWKLNGKVSLVAPELDGRRVALYLNTGTSVVSRVL